MFCRLCSCSFYESNQFLPQETSVSVKITHISKCSTVQLGLAAGEDSRGRCSVEEYWVKMGVRSFRCPFGRFHRKSVETSILFQQLIKIHSFVTADQTLAFTCQNHQPVSATCLHGHDVLQGHLKTYGGICNEIQTMTQLKRKDGLQETTPYGILPARSHATPQA